MKGAPADRVYWLMVQLAVWGLKLDCPVVYYTQVDWGNPVIDFLASPFLGEEQPRSQGLSLLRGGDEYTKANNTIHPKDNNSVHNC